MKLDFDVLVVGGGLVGASFLSALAKQSLSVGLIEASPLPFSIKQPSRAIALAKGSQNIFSTLGVWPELESFATNIEKVHVSHRGSFGATRFSAVEEGVDALGYVVNADKLTSVLQQFILQAQDVHVFDHTSVKQCCKISHGYELVLDNGKTMRCRLLVAADGANSTVRSLLNIGTTVRDYRQTALVASVQLARSHNNIAYERLTHLGPLAFLPMPDNCCKLVWALDAEEAKETNDLSDSALLKKLQSYFGYRLGRFLSVSHRVNFPLYMTTANEQVRQSLVLLGNAAHSLHPVAAQGFNLGLRDAACLAQVILSDENFSDKTVLEKYVSWRKRDQWQISRFTDGLVRVFSNETLPFVLGRDLGLLAIDNFSLLKKQLSKRTMGLSGRLPNLAMGLAVHEQSV